MTPEMRSQRLIGNSNPRYKWERYFKTEAELKTMKKPIREYYERNNSLIQQYLYIDKLLDSSLPHDLIAEYHHAGNNRNSTPNLHTINEEVASPAIQIGATSGGNGYLENANGGSSTPNTNASTGDSAPTGAPVSKLKRTPKNLYKLPDEQTPLIRVPSKGDAEISEGNTSQEDEEEESEQIILPDYDQEESTSSSSPVVLTAIYLNLTANTLLLILKIIVSLLTSSVSVLASTVDAALDFLSTAIIWTTTRLISMQDRDRYPVGRRRLEPIGVLVFSVIMITSFVQVALEGFNRLNSPSPHTVVQLTYAAIAIMASTVVIKAGCWFWCRLVNNSSVQALAQDAKTDVVFNVFSIVFPIVGYYAKVWWLDSLGGILLSGYVIYSWSATSSTHIRQLTGAAATADERNVLLYLTMRFAHTIKQIQGLQAYHAGDKLNVEVDVVLDEATSLRDSHDLGESLQYVLESVPYVDRAFVHLDYAGWNLPSHMEQQE
ncbi:hypothetical protein EJ08DRAFT_650686 [Tothia fuscella]|uniref:Cation efflux protein transmembrane domain-containing protein n=1 Tax=Tothia fuscella TaxID=1048955 RepID=A0A9P4NP48_9PEZI|nr:hypothetical protein EJ08DRAFT_650686 [Tothia fuscella]